MHAAQSDHATPMAGRPAWSTPAINELDIWSTTEAKGHNTTDSGTSKGS